MDELDKKILDVIEDNQYIDGEFLRHASNETKRDAVGQIKQAFIDAGWIREINLNVPPETPYTPKSDLTPYFTEMIKAYIKAGGAADCVLMSRRDWEVNSKLSGMMTGAEWYAKFEKELQSIGVKDNIRSVNGTIAKNCAKKASGIA